MVGRDPCESDGHGNVGYVPMAMTGYLEEARAGAQRTLLPGAGCGSGQDGVTAPAFLASAKRGAGGPCLDAALRDAGRDGFAGAPRHRPPGPTAARIPPPRRPRNRAAGGEADRVLGPELARLTERFTVRVTFRGRRVILRGPNRSTKSRSSWVADIVVSPLESIIFEATVVCKLTNSSGVTVASPPASLENASGVKCIFVGRKRKAVVPVDGQEHRAALRLELRTQEQRRRHPGPWSREIFRRLASSIGFDVLPAGAASVPPQPARASVSRDRDGSEHRASICRDVFIDTH